MLLWIADPRKAALLSRKLPDIPTTPTSPPSDILHLQQNPNFLEEESSSAGSGTLFTVGDNPGDASVPPTSNGTSTNQAGEAGRDFFAQLDWQEHQKKVESAGYAPYQDRIPEDFDSASTSSGSSSSGGSSDNEFNHFQMGAVSAGSKPLEEGEGLLIGNVGVGSEPAGVKDRESRNPQIKLIEFGAEQGESQTPQPSSTKPAPYVDPFQQKPASSTAPTTGQSADLLGGGASMDMFSDVVFDPFGGLSAVPSKNSDAPFGDLLGLGSGSAKDATTATTTPTTAAPSTGGQGSGGATDLMSSSSADDMFDPFGSIGAGSKATKPSSHGSDGDLMGDAPTLMPMPTFGAPAQPYMGHRFSEPFAMQSSNLSSPSKESRKLSSPTPGEMPRPPTHTSSNTLSASFSSNVSLSQPNLASFGTSRQPSATPAGWGGSGFRGSASHNTSPRRSPSPNAPMPHSSASMGNIAQHQQLDPFGQFNLNAMTGSGAKAPPASTRPASASTTQGRPPPTGNSYQPYYMQNQTQHRNNGIQGHRNGMQQPVSAQIKTGIGSKPKATSAFSTRPQSPNYNPSLFSVGNKTGIIIMVGMVGDPGRNPGSMIQCYYQTVVLPFCDFSMLAAVQ